MGHHLGVRVRGQPVAGDLQFLPQDLKIFDDSVMHHGHFFGRMGVSINLVRDAMGGPAGVADANGSRQWLMRQAGRQID